MRESIINVLPILGNTILDLQSVELFPSRARDRAHFHQLRGFRKIRSSKLSEPIQCLFLSLQVSVLLY